MYWTLSETAFSLDPTDLILDGRATVGHLHIHLNSVYNVLGVFLLQKQPKIEDPKYWIWHDISSHYSPELLNAEPFIRHPSNPNIALKVDEKLTPRYVLVTGLRHNLVKSGSGSKPTVK